MSQQQQQGDDDDDDDDEWRVSSSSPFTVICDAIRRNDPSVTEIPLHVTYPDGYGYELGDALQQNEYVSQLTIHLDTIWKKESVNSIQNNTNPTNTSNSRSELEEDPQQQFLPLLNYIRHGTALRSVSLKTSSRTPSTERRQYVTMLLQAIGDSPYLEELNIQPGIYLPVDVFSSMMQSMQSLTRLDLHLEIYASEENPDLDESRRQRYIDGFRCNPYKSLEYLSITFQSDAILVAGVLHTIQSSYPSLREVRFRCNNNGDDALIIQPFITAISDLIRHHNATSYHAATTIRNLYLSKFNFDMDGMETLLLGIHSSSSSLRKLVLDSCRFNVDATTEFVRYWQSDRCIQESLCELHMISPPNILFAPEPFLGRNCAQVMAAILLTPLAPDSNHVGTKKCDNTHSCCTTRRMTTIGSTLTMLEYDCWDVGRLFKAISSSAALQIRLPTLHLGDVSCDDWIVLMQCLPDIVYIEQIHVTLMPLHTIHGVPVTTFRPSVNGNIQGGDMVQALRQNGSLYSFTVSEKCLCDPTRTTPITFLSDMELRHVNAYLKRNEFVKTLLRGPQLMMDDDNHNHILDSTNPSLFPSLFQSMKPAARIAPNLIFLGVLTLSDFI